MTPTQAPSSPGNAADSPLGSPPNHPAGEVIFSYTDWLAAYPVFAGHVSTGQAEGFFQLAGLILNNTARSPVPDLAQRRILLWLLVAHQAQLFASTATPATQGDGMAGSEGTNPPTAPQVGRLASATRGSVSVSMDGSALPRQAGWFTQTQYGLTFWQATAPYRQMRFLPGRTHPAQIWP